MIYLSNTTDAQLVRFPDNGLGGAGDQAVTLAVKSTVGRATVLEIPVSLLPDGDYYAAEITLSSGLSDGEYEYKLTADGGPVLGSGLLQIGDMDRVEKQASGGPLELIQSN